jgi:hypothetical protein
LAATLLIAVAVIAAAVAPANAQCLVAVAADDGSGPNEIAGLHATLAEFGCTWVDVTTVAEARSAGATVLIDRYAANNFPAVDVDAWLADGFGFIQMGDWPPWFANGYESQTSGTPLTITVIDAGHPLTEGLPASWTGLGFWAYDWGSDALGWATDPAYPNLIEGSYGTPQPRTVTGADVGPGRAVYIGINTYGPLASDNDKRVLSNAISWSGGALVAVQIPVLDWAGIAVFVLLLGILGTAMLIRLRH